MTKYQKKKRVHPRIPFKESIQIRPLTDDKNKEELALQSCQCHDISGGGLSVYVEQAYPREVVFRLLIPLNKEAGHLKHESKNTLQIIGKVMWCKEVKLNSYIIGIQFLNIYKDDFQFLCEYVIEELAAKDY